MPALAPVDRPPEEGRAVFVAAAGVLVSGVVVVSVTDEFVGEGDEVNGVVDVVGGADDGTDNDRRNSSRS